MYWVMPELSSKEAEAEAVAACKAQGGKDCKKVGWFADSCLAYAYNTNRDLFSGSSVAPELAAKKAIRRCTAESPAGNCKLMDMPVCVGPGYAVADQQAALKTPRAEVDALGARLDKRGYWGAIAETEDGGLTYSDNYPSEEEAVKTLMEWEDCKGCTKLLTYENACVGLAWIKGGEKKRGTSFTKLAATPVDARNQARAACTAKTGSNACVAMVRCSGRQFMDGYPGMDEKPN